MEDQIRTKIELMNELTELRARIARLERAGTGLGEPEEAFCTNQSQLSDAMDLAHIVYWEVDCTTGEFVFNDAFYAFYGTTAGQEGGYRMSREEYGKRFMHPDDIPVFRQAAEERLANEEPEFLYHVEHRIIRRDGEVRHVLARVHVNRDGSGRIFRYYGANQDVTERQHAREALQQSEAMYRSLFNNALEGIACCRVLFEDDRPIDFIYLDTNHAFEQLTGLKDVVGKKVTEVIPGILEAHPELFETYGRVTLSGNSERFEIEFKPLAQWLSISVYSTGNNCFVAVFDNITDRRQAEKALRESERRFKGAFETSAVGMALVGLDGHWLKVNHSLCNIVGYPEEELLSKSLQDITHPGDLENDLEHLRRLTADEIPHYQIEKRCCHRDGYVVRVLLYKSIVRDTRGYPLYFVTQIEDITERKLLEEKLQTISVMDELTGLYNRRVFFTLSEQQLKLAMRMKSDLTLFYADLDGLKWINDTLGHIEGDAALVAVAQILKGTFRESDIIARIGGDEFAVLSFGVRDTHAITSRLRANIAKYNERDARRWSLSLSVGVVRCEAVESATLEAAIAQADTSMYEEKRKKRAQWQPAASSQA